MKMENGEIQIDPYEIVEALTSEQKHEMLKHYMVSDDVVTSVIAWMCDEDEDGWWAGGSHKLRERLFKKVEDCHLAKLARFNWSSLDEAIPKIKKIRSEQHLYWTLYHHPDAHNMTISEWIRTRGNEICEHTTKVADDEIDEIREALRLEVLNLSPKQEQSKPTK